MVAMPSSIPVIPMHPEAWNALSRRDATAAGRFVFGVTTTGIYCDSRSRGYTAWWVSPLLVLTLLVGPVGLLVYLVARTGIGGANVAADPA